MEQRKPFWTGLFPGLSPNIGIFVCSVGIWISIQDSNAWVYFFRKKTPAIQYRLGKADWLERDYTVEMKRKNRSVIDKNTILVSVGSSSGRERYALGIDLFLFFPQNIQIRIYNDYPMLEIMYLGQA